MTRRRIVAISSSMSNSRFISSGLFLRERREREFLLSHTLSLPLPLSQKNNKNNNKKKNTSPSAIHFAILRCVPAFLCQYILCACLTSPTHRTLLSHTALYTVPLSASLALLHAPRTPLTYNLPSVIHTVCLPASACHAFPVHTCDAMPLPVRKGRVLQSIVRCSEAVMSVG